MQPRTDDTPALGRMPLGVCNWIYMKPVLQLFLGTRSSPENLVCSWAKGRGDQPSHVKFSWAPALRIRQYINTKSVQASQQRYLHLFSSSCVQVLLFYSLLGKADFNVIFDWFRALLWLILSITEFAFFPTVSSMRPFLFFSATEPLWPPMTNHSRGWLLPPGPSLFTAVPQSPSPVLSLLVLFPSSFDCEFRAHSVGSPASLRFPVIPLESPSVLPKTCVLLGHVCTSSSI